MVHSFSELKAHFAIISEKENSAQAKCPAHDDQHASLTITHSPEKNQALIFCHAGCDYEDVLEAAQLSKSDLFYNQKIYPSNIYQYRKIDGDLSHEKLKFIKPDNSKTFTQRRIDEHGNIVSNLTGIDKIPYRYPELCNAINKGSPVLYVEGEKDVETARLLGYTSTTMGGASDWKDEYKNFFNKSSIILIPDKDAPGIKSSNKVADSLLTVTKSLRILILPTGKDLTEWVEAGNNDLSPLIETSIEKVKSFGISKPSIQKYLNNYTFKWNDLGLKIDIDNLKDDFDGNIICYENDAIFYTSTIGLLKARTKADIAKRLYKNKKIDWDGLLEYITNYCVQSVKDSGDVVDIDQKPSSMQLQYILYPILLDNEPTTIYCAGGKGKSILADYISILVSRGMNENPTQFTANRARNVLYLDWEGELETHRRYITAIKRGLNVNGNIPIMYKKIEHPLSQVIDSVRNTVKAKNIGLVIIDSQMAATASGTRGLTEAQIASEYYNNLRSLECATLTIDHITKQGMNDNGAEAPYGSVVKYNRSRSQFELRLDDSMDEQDLKQFALIHRKFNLGRKQKPIGFSVEFINNDLELSRIIFNSCDPSQQLVNPKKEKDKEKLIKALRDGDMTKDELCLATGVSSASLKKILQRDNGETMKEEDGYIIYVNKDLKICP